jgi:N-acetylglucosamine-6-phosphate deacetylase
MLAITAKRLYGGAHGIEQPLVLVDDGKVLEVTTQDGKAAPKSARFIDLQDAILAPGYIDIHVHGGAGHDLMTNDDRGRADFERMLAKHGVTAYLPTTVTAPLDRTFAALDRLAGAIEGVHAQKDSDRAHPAGIHLEGPFLSHAKRGVHPAEDLLPASLETFDRMWQAARGHIKMITIAPELEGAQEVIVDAHRRGVCVSVGHSNADMKTTRSAIALGAQHATHTFNAMRPLDHREPGILGEVLTNSQMSADVIVDGVHVDPTIIRLFLRCKGPERAVLITDGLSATGMPEGKYRLGSLEIEVKDLRCTANGTLAGSVLTMDRAVQNVMQFANWELPETLRLAARNPARVVGLEQKGRIEPGCDADFVVLNAKGEVQKTIIAGRI